SNIWAMMKALCETAQVSAIKVFPHNLRHLFARCFYQSQQDLEHLASLLGHSSINTTRIYTRASGKEHLRQIEQLRSVPTILP
ncbi:MAG: tyrosine-type recombinase/integrase, partial [Candidatus Fournierella pullistercoris]|nr:tyrosine-type recombinase/integrase [Candidatus Fournierella pullistercoris]